MSQEYTDNVVDLADAFQGRKPEITLGLIVAGRNELCAASRWLFSHIPPSLLQNRNEPIKVAVNGSECGGKKIIPDAVREYFFTWDQDFEGRAEYDEYIDTPNLSFAFVNANWHPSKFGSPVLRAQQSNAMVVKTTLDQMDNGGIVFIHNALQPIDWADIQIDLRSELDVKYNVADPSYRDDLREKLRAVPHKGATPGGDGIQRLIRVKIFNKELAENPSMQSLVRKFEAHEPAFRSVIENDHEVLDGEAQECDFVVFDPKDFKPVFHELTSDPAHWKNAPPKVKYN